MIFAPRGETLEDALALAKRDPETAGPEPEVEDPHPAGPAPSDPVARPVRVLFSRYAASFGRWFKSISEGRAGRPEWARFQGETVPRLQKARSFSEDLQE